jgi:DNA-binding XRE family transcriptional regulator
MNINRRKRKTPGFGTSKAAHEVTCPRCNGTGKVTADGISIGDRFRACRMKAAKTQAEMAPVLAISRAQLANLEGDRSRPGLEMLVKAANAYGVSVDYLLGRT